MLSHETVGSTNFPTDRSFEPSADTCFVLVVAAAEEEEENDKGDFRPSLQFEIDGLWSSISFKMAFLQLLIIAAVLSSWWDVDSV
jgi:hypothetical protein